MGKGLARLIGSGIGFTSEAIHAARHPSAYKTPRGFPSDTPSTFPTGEAGGHEQSRDLRLDEDLPVYSPGETRYNEATYPDEKSRNHAYEAGEDSGDEYDDIVRSEEMEREVGGDEEAWELDEVSEALAADDEFEGVPGQLPRRDTDDDPDAIHQEDSAETKEKKTERMIRELVTMAGPPGPKQKLPCPVIIPQRRPGAKRRGFVRAYAPVLQDCGIGQDVFLKFISDFHKSSQASMWLQVIVLSANLTGFAPMLSVSLTALAVQIIAETAMQMQIRKRTTSYLDRVNKEIFMPRGQYAMIMKFSEKPPKPKKKKNGAASDPLADMFTMEQVNISGGVGKEGGPEAGPAPTTPEFDAAETIAKYTHTEEHPEMNAWKTRMKGFRLESGHTRGQMQLPECAPLVYPRIGRAALRIQEGKDPKSTFQSGRSWAREYLDRRRQIEFESEHKGSALAITEDNRKPFTHNGDLISTLTGGKFSRKKKPGLIERAGSAIKERNDRKRALQGLPPSETLREKINRKKKEQGNKYKLFREDVLYLMIVNMPTPEELEQAVARLRYMVDLEQADKEKGKAK
ncbi:hypothetical protein CONLIGDRAFT_665376 [Coniochaeta ligniaria NRRL 30616]|uniref:Uncharacterized protein n=1 Tax=Coniochaeta ligniaria NRRL 30616 TaxID=1408157 RepID=A0A1J7K3B9_9PEZI|nr:hypothetical protein CONLIGDRAFT_665376 [Coniochaeta ligniaria NRRL 30616]